MKFNARINPQHKATPTRMAWKNFPVKPQIQWMRVILWQVNILPDYLGSIDNPGGGDRDYVPDQSSENKDGVISILYIQIPIITTPRHGETQRAVAIQCLPASLLDCFALVSVRLPAPQAGG